VDVARSQFHSALKHVVDGPDYGRRRSPDRAGCRCRRRGALFRLIDVHCARGAFVQSQFQNRPPNGRRKDATAIATGRTADDLRCLIAAPSAGSETARPKAVVPQPKRENRRFAQKSRREMLNRTLTFVSCCKPARATSRSPLPHLRIFRPAGPIFPKVPKPVPRRNFHGADAPQFYLAASGIRSSKCRRNCSMACLEVANRHPLPAGT